jgi:hypothetical protein
MSIQADNIRLAIVDDHKMLLGALTECPQRGRRHQHGRRRRHVA